MNSSISLNSDTLSGRLLIAVPGLEDPNFKQSVVVICEHSKEGSFGLIINKILMNSVRPLLESLELSESSFDIPVFYGGPVKPEQGYILYEPFDEKYSSIKVAKDIAVTASKEILFDIAGGVGPMNYIFALGFAGWGPGQLEEELMLDSWLVAPFEPELIFRVPVGERWHAAADSVGIDLSRFVGKSGRA